MSDAANPERGAEEIGPPKSAFDQAVERVSKTLESPEGDQPKKPAQPAEDVAEPTQEEPDEPNAASEEADEAETEETVSEDPETESEEQEEESLPDTLEDLAAAYEMSPEDLAQLLKVQRTVNGKREQITLAEALKDHQFEADYRQKTSQLADERRALESERQQVRERLQIEYQQAAGLVQILEERLRPQSEGLDVLLDPNSPHYAPEQYHLRKAQMDRDKETLEAAKGRLREAHQRVQWEQQQKVQTYRVEQQRLLSEKIPEISDPEKGPVFERNLTKYLSNEGFSPEEVQGFFLGPFDHRQVVIARKAMLYDAFEQGKKQVPKKLKAIPKVTKPGATKGIPSAEDKRAATRDRLKRAKGRSAQMDAATALVRDML